jgi:hypothetical protein
MLAIHDRFSRRVRNRLKNIGMGLGLVRLLQDAGRIGEARTVLSGLENGVYGIAGIPIRPPCSIRRRRLSVMAKSA